MGHSAVRRSQVGRLRSDPYSGRIKASLGQAPWRAHLFCWCSISRPVSWVIGIQPPVFIRPLCSPLLALRQLIRVVPACLRRTSFFHQWRTKVNRRGQQSAFWASDSARYDCRWRFACRPGTNAPHRPVRTACTAWHLCDSSRDCSVASPSCFSGEPRLTAISYATRNPRPALRLVIAGTPRATLRQSEHGDERSAPPDNAIISRATHPVAAHIRDGSDATALAGTRPPWLHRNQLMSA